jgi:aspartyl-tRNA(Asn)/glutamyl-tRNA(Gln) amidotransferase subunit C
VVRLSDEELKKIEKLAAVKLEGKAREKLKGQLARIIDFVRKLEKIDTTGYSPRAYVGDLEPLLREDGVGESLDRDEVIAQAPDSEDGLFRVPPVIDKQ